MANLESKMAILDEAKGDDMARLCQKSCKSLLSPIFPHYSIPSSQPHPSTFHINPLRTIPHQLLSSLRPFIHTSIPSKFPLFTFPLLRPPSSSMPSITLVYPPSPHPHLWPFTFHIHSTPSPLPQVSSSSTPQLVNSLSPFYFSNFGEGSLPF